MSNLLQNLEEKYRKRIIQERVRSEDVEGEIDEEIQLLLKGEEDLTYYFETFTRYPFLHSMLKKLSHPLLNNTSLQLYNILLDDISSEDSVTDYLGDILPHLEKKGVKEFFGPIFHHPFMVETMFSKVAMYNYEGTLEEYQELIKKIISTFDLPEKYLDYLEEFKAVNEKEEEHIRLSNERIFF